MSSTMNMHNTDALPNARPFYKVVVHGKETFEIDQRYQNLKYISAGAYGMVASATDNITGRKVAIKKIKGTFRDLTDAKRILRELKLLRHLGGHENCIWILDVMVSPQIKNFSDVYIVTDLMDTDLYRIIESPQNLTEAHIKYFLYQILRGLKFIHSAGILHRDLKPQNILCNASCELVVADFGLARFVPNQGNSNGGGTNNHPLSTDSHDSTENSTASSNSNTTSTTNTTSSNPSHHQATSLENQNDLTQYVVTRWYRAPELLVNCKTYDAAVDVWSVGCIFAEMLGRRPLLPGKDYIDQLKLTITKLGSPSESDLHFIQNNAALKIIQTMGTKIPRIDWNIRYPKANPLALDLLDKMLQFNPNKRISVIDALAHPWLTDYAAPHDEPLSRPIDPMDWAFDVTTTPLSKSEIQALMLKEMEFFRPTNDRLRPQSTRLAALGRATTTTTTASTSTTTTTNPSQNTSGTASGSSNSKHVSPPVNATNHSKDNTKKENKASVLPVVTASKGTVLPSKTTIQHTTTTNTTVNSVAAILAMASKEINTSTTIVTTKPVISAHTVPPAPVLPSNPVGNDTGKGTATGAIGSSNTDVLLAALLEQMKGFRQDLLLSIDQRTSSIVEKQFDVRLEPILHKLTELEHKLGNKEDHQPVSK